jgi:short-subunit dehydrogenase
MAVRRNDWPFRSALVTGASSGIGACIAEMLAEADVPVVVVARRADRLQSLADRFSNVEVLAADLGDPDGLAMVEARVRETDRPVDLVVNNAGFGTSGRFHHADVDRLSAEVSLNVTALTRLSHAAMSVMAPRGRGYLLNVSSMVSFQPAPLLAVYTATKAYVTSLSESLHEEARGSGVHVTALCPGLTKTEFQRVSSSESYAGQYPRVMWTKVETVARTGLDGVARGRALAIPGWQYKTMGLAVGLLPRRVLRRASGLVQRD